MNLSINFEENINRDIGYYQTNPFEILLNGATLKELSIFGQTHDRELSNLTNIDEIINLNEFVW